MSEPNASTFLDKTPRLRYDSEACSVDKYLDKIAENWPLSRFDVAPAVLVESLEEAIRRFPHSAQLWCRLGDVLQTGASTPLTVSSAMECYENALANDPLCGEAYEEAGFLLDILDDPAALDAFRMAIRCSGSIESYLAIARMCHEGGNAADANMWLTRAHDSFSVALKRIEDAIVQLKNDGATD